MNKPFAALSYEEQVTHLTGAAASVLPAYGLSGAALELLAYQSNAMFAVWMAGRRTAALRLYRPGHKPLRQIESEHVLLTYLSRETDLPVPRPLLTREGDSLAFAPVDGLTDPLPAALFTWREGIGFSPESLPAGCAEAAGMLLARLHQALESFVQPADFTRPTLDAEGLFGSQSQYHSAEASAIFTPDQRAIFEAVEAQTRAAMSALLPQAGAFGLIHADFIPKNLLFAAADEANQTLKGMSILDFEDCATGFRLYDLAPALWQFKDTGRYPALREAFVNGYTARRPLTTSEATALDLFIAARQVASCRWLAANAHNPRIRSAAPTLIARRAAELEAFLAQGRFPV